MSDKRKQSLYFPDGVLAKLTATAKRLDRSLSWVVQKAVEAGLEDIERKYKPRGEP